MSDRGENGSAGVAQRDGHLFKIIYGFAQSVTHIPDDGLVAFRLLNF